MWQDMVVIKGGRAFVVDPTVDDAGATSGGNAGQPVPRKAALSVSVLQHIGRNVSIAEVQLTTGRLHQIRVQVCTGFGALLPRSCAGMIHAPCHLQPCVFSLLSFPSEFFCRSLVYHIVPALMRNSNELVHANMQGASRGHFVLGDNIYGEPRVPGITRLCLHCSQMEVAHPSRPGEVVTVSAPVPDELLDVVDKQALAVARGSR